MIKQLSVVVVALLGSAAVPVPITPPSRDAVVGPGGVVATIRAFLRYQDENRNAAAFLGAAPQAVDVVIDADGSIRTTEKDARIASFIDLSADGMPLAAATPEAFAALLDEHVDPSKHAARTLRTEVHAIRATCESENCSWAIVDFERVYTTGRTAEVRVPMRATALLRWDKTEFADFRIFHWHASRATAPAAPETAKRSGD